VQTALFAQQRVSKDRDYRLHFTSSQKMPDTVSIRVQFINGDEYKVALPLEVRSFSQTFQWQKNVMAERRGSGHFA
jgi:hypothetical protein